MDKTIGRLYWHNIIHNETMYPNYFKECHFFGSNDNVRIGMRNSILSHLDGRSIVTGRSHVRPVSTYPLLLPILKLIFINH